MEDDEPHSSYADDEPRHAAKMMHADSQALQAAQAGKTGVTGRRDATKGKRLPVRP